MIDDRVDGTDVLILIRLVSLVQLSIDLAYGRLFIVQLTGSGCGCHALGCNTMLLDSRYEPQSSLAILLRCLERLDFYIELVHVSCDLLYPVSQDEALLEGIRTVGKPRVIAAD